MTSYVFPTLQGLTFDVSRTPMWHTEKQQALSGKRSTIAYQQYPLTHFELTFSILRDDQTPSDVKALVGLFNACQGMYDTFLFTDPDFNSVTGMQIAVGDGSTTAFQTTVTYQNTGGPGGAELVQNFNATTYYPTYQIQRYGSLYEYVDQSNRNRWALQSQTFSNSVWNKANVTVSTSSVLAPDGTSTASNLVDSTNSNVQHDVNQSLGASAASAYCGSIFAWGGPTEARYLYLQLQDLTTNNVAQGVFDLTNGVVVSSSASGTWSGVQAEISVATTESGYPWYRVSVVATKSGTNSTAFVIAPSSSSSNISYAGTNGTTAAVIWGAQFEDVIIYPSGISPAGGGAYPSMYFLTTTAVVNRADTTFSTGGGGVITFTTAPASGTIISWSGQFYYRCEFDEDELKDLVKFLKQWWSLKKLSFTSIKL